MKLDVLDAGTAADLDRAFAAIVTGDPFFVVNRAKIAEFAASKRLPAVHFSKLFAESGGLMSYGASLEESYQRAATYVDKILRAYGDDGANASSWRSGGAGLTR